MGRYKVVDALKLSERVQVLLLPSDMKEVKRLAEAKGERVSAFIRGIILEEIERQSQFVIPYVRRRKRAD